jgi:hypothetical protein
MSTSNFLPLRYVERPGRKVYCRRCQMQLASGNRYQLIRISREIWAVEHFGDCPPLTKNPVHSTDSVMQLAAE